MAAMLERHARDGKPTPSNIPAKEIIPCSNTECPFSYTLSYTEDEHFLSGTELNTAKMRRLAVALIEKADPAHNTKNYIWKGAERGWVEADSMAARKSL
jgi:hypothetical protein